MSTEKELPQNSLVELLLKQAYAHPKWAHIRFPNTTLCPTCRTEVAFVIHQNDGQRLMLCFNCGYRYHDAELIA